MIVGTTRLVALLGHPVAHSLSPRMQNAAFAALALDLAYVAFDVEPERFDEAVRSLVELGFVGANATAPHKRAAAALAGSDEPSVNTLVFRDGGIEGHSTDAAVLAGLTAVRPVIVGGGGSAAAFAAALPYARSFERRGDWPPAVEDADLVVHATPVRDEVLVRVGAGQTLVDLPYPGSATAAAAREAGATVYDGLDVLVAQGAASFALWTGLPAPVDVMRAAIRR
ncbi:MAG: shikimate dehydrogenase (NADP+) [Gaiellaceae bacterium]